MYSNKVKFFLLVLITSVFTSLFLLQHKSRRSHQEALQKRTTELNELHGLWLKYKEKSIINGRVIAHDENGITTSEGQSYAMLRAVWSNDTQGFSEIWNWTKTNLKRPKDHLFSWKWKNHIIDANTATDADSDIALALILGSRRFKNQTYLDQAKLIISDLKKIDFVTVGRWNIPHAGNWTHKDRYIKVHIGYLSSYAYREFGQIDPTFDWDRVANDSTALIHWLLSDKKIKFLPEYVFLDRKTGDIHIKHPETNQQADFGYDVFPLFWRLAVDAQWNNQDHSTIGDLLLKPFKSEMYDKQKIFDRYSIQANQLSHHEADTLYLTLSSLSESIDPLFYKLISDSKLGAIWRRANSDEALPYYVQNWIWFHKALQLGAVENFSSNPILKNFNPKTFLAHFPLIPIAITIGLFLTGLKSYLCRFAFLASAFYILLYYLSWRAVNSLNLKDPVGVIASFLLLIAEFYGVASLLLLWLQVGTPKKSNGQTKKIENDLNLILNLNMANILSDQIKYEPTVDIYIPIYNEPIQILEATLIGATFMDYEKKSIFVCDDGHRSEVEKLAQSFGATYLKGPKKQAKSGNINNALKNSKSEFCVVFDTDHIPTKEFLKETIKYFRDDKLGFIQTPHVFYNQDIFQRSYSWFKNLGNEQDLFNQEIQDRRNQWGGTFFVGSGAVFRRKALEEINGFKLGTVTEDIHTSQELHSRGWTSRFVAKNLAVGLSTDTLRAYLVQRTRWMQGCLQIFFKDNPILKQGLTTRQRLGYFASLWYFFFPLARVIYWLSPLYFLLAHGHPLLCDFSALLSYLLPFMLLRPMITGILMPDWKRGIMGAIYEAAIVAPLAVASLRLLIPTEIEFAVTPKSKNDQALCFDWKSTLPTIVVLLMKFVAIAKGIIEMMLFGIESDAYVFNMGWAIVNLIFMGTAVYLGFPNQELRQSTRLKRKLPILVKILQSNLLAQIENCGVQIFHRQTSDLSLSGMSFLDNEANYKIGDAVEIELKKTTFFGTVKRISQSNQIAGLVYVIQFADLEPHQKSILMEELFLSKRVWQYWHVRKSHRYLLSMLLTPLIKSRRFILEWFRESRLEMFNLGSFSRLTNNTNSPASDAGWLKKRTP